MDILDTFLIRSEGGENKTKTPRLINHSRRDWGLTCAKYGHVRGKERMSEKGGYLMASVRIGDTSFHWRLLVQQDPADRVPNSSSENHGNSRCQSLVRTSFLCGVVESHQVARHYLKFYIIKILRHLHWSL